MTASRDPSLTGGQLLGLRFVLRGAPVRHPYLSPFMGSNDRRILWDVSERETGTRFDVEDLVRSAGGRAVAQAGNATAR